MGNSDILIREITRKSEIVDNSTWVLVNDGGSNVLLHRASKDVAKALSDGMRCYYVSPDVFVGDFHFDNVLFSEKPNGLSVDVSFRMKVLPEMSGFADWVKTNVEYKLTIGEFVERMSKPKYGLKQFLQHSLEGVTNFDLLRKHANACLQNGVCIDEQTGGLRLSSTSRNTWVSKVILTIFAMEQVLSIDLPSSLVREVIHWVQVSARETTISDQILCDTRQVVGGPYYPRIVTSALWL